MRVCFAVDGTPISEGAFDFYYDNMHRASNEIVFVHIQKNVDLCDLSKERMSQIDPQIILDALEAAEKSAQDVKDKFLDKVKNYDNVTVKDFVIRQGSSKAGESIIGAATKAKCDLIITGTRGLDDAKRLILGSVSDYIVHHSWIPTMVCPRQSNH